MISIAIIFITTVSITIITKLVFVQGPFLAPRTGSEAQKGLGRGWGRGSTRDRMLCSGV